MKKLSVIRGDSVSNCPYGLPITEACENIGDTIFTMQALPLVDDEEKAEALKRNKIIYLTQQAGQRCPFANTIMDKFNKVDCSWGDTAAGEGIHHFTPSPMYPNQFFIGNGYGLGTPSVSYRGTPDRRPNITDPRLYFDAPERDINVPFGLYSIFADKENEAELLKLAVKYTNKISFNVKNINMLREKYYDVLAYLMNNRPAKTLDEKELTYLLNIIKEW